MFDCLEPLKTTDRLQILISYNNTTVARLEAEVRKIKFSKGNNRKHVWIYETIMLTRTDISGKYILAFSKTESLMHKKAQLLQEDLTLK